MTERYHGVFPSSYEALRQLPGIGDYTAGAIASIAFSLPVPAVDGNVLRVLSRIYALSDDISQEKNRKKFRSLAQQLLPVNAPGAFNQALMELGATICLPNSVPQCLLCPADMLCDLCRNVIGNFGIRTERFQERKPWKNCTPSAPLRSVSKPWGKASTSSPISNGTCRATSPFWKPPALWVAEPGPHCGNWKKITQSPAHFLLLKKHCWKI